jgi:hypothetical protein
MARQPVYDRELLTAPELAERSGLDVRRVRIAIRDGGLRAYTPAGTTLPRVFWGDFVEWVRQSPVRPAGAPEGGGPP